MADHIWHGIMLTHLLQEEEFPLDIVLMEILYLQFGIDLTLRLLRYALIFFRSMSILIRPQQIIADHAQAIAKTYNSAVYRKAADDLRLPYWDWAAPPYGFPAVLSSPTVQIETPSGFETVNNPLFQYTFLNHPEPQEWFPTKGVGSDAWFGEQPFTVRWPDAYNQSQNSIPSGIFSAEGGYLASQVVRILLNILRLD